MMRTRSRQCAAARPTFVPTSQNPPSAASDNVIKRMAATAQRPAEEKPEHLAFVLDEAAAHERERPLAQRRRQARLVGREKHRGASGPDVLDDVDDLGGH